MSGSADFSHEELPRSDQAALEADQTLADADQTAADSDQNGSDQDQAAAQSDQELSDRDQEASDLEFRSNSSDDPVLLRAYREARSKRGAGTLRRTTAGATRARISAQRDALAIRREENAGQRDKTAAARDAIADKADRRAGAAASELGDLDPRTEAALAVAARAREKAAAARARAALDRRKAAHDREAAALDRAHLLSELRRSQFDDLTGAFRRGIGEVLVGSEIERARRDGGRLQVAFIDVDDLKGTNDTIGHAAGDSALRCVYAAFRVRLRPYDPIIRWGGDEFVCVMPGSDAEDARRRIEATRADLARLDPRVFVSFGLASLSEDDTVMSLIERADQALFEARGRRA